jgi:hypothetical protein
VHQAMQKVLPGVDEKPDGGQRVKGTQKRHGTTHMAKKN